MTVYVTNWLYFADCCLAFVHVKYAQHVRSGENSMPQSQKQNVTVRLSSQTVKKAKILAAKRSTSISALVAELIESLVDKDDAYERAAASALARMKRGFHLGGGPLVSRDELHER